MTRFACMLGMLVAVIASLPAEAATQAATDARSRTGGTPTIIARITLGAAPVLTRVSGTETMTVSNMTLNGARDRRFPASGLLDVRVGGRLNVAANQRDGLYNGTLTVTVDYL